MLPQIHPNSRLKACDGAEDVPLVRAWENNRPPPRGLAVAQASVANVFSSPRASFVCVCSYRKEKSQARSSESTLVSAFLPSTLPLALGAIT